jgi:hypothetical protein
MKSFVWKKYLKLKKYERHFHYLGSGKINWGEGLEIKPLAESKDGHPDFTLNPSPKKSFNVSQIS